MKRLVVLGLVVLLFAACAFDDDEADTSEVESAGTTYQGTTYQGTTYQGTTYQGTTYQGTTYQGTTYQGTTYQGVSYGSSSSATGTASVTKSTIEVWRRSGTKRWEQRLPNRICIWDDARTDIVAPCTNYPLSSSPLVGVKFKGRFYDPNTGSTRTGWLRIRSVSTDPTYAMHPLNGAATGQLKAYDGTTCTNFEGCRRNTDLYLYELELLDSDGSIDRFCYPGEKAFAFAGTWDLTGKRTSSSRYFTFACTNGTIAKCARWGYRPFDSATTVGAQHVSRSLAGYHQSCVRAATADYCADGTSFTRDGTLIDIYDYNPHEPYAYGLIPRTQSWLYVTGQRGATSLQWESRFDNLGAVALDFERYDEAGSVFSNCPFTFTLGTAPTPTEPHQSKDREGVTSGPLVTVDTTTVCAHDETTQGRWMDFRCSACTTKFYGKANLSHCIAGGQWDATCVKAARDMCTPDERMGIETNLKAAHSECSTGGPLYQFGTACTLRLCSDPAHASCCSATGSWTSSCTAAANSTCIGGLEGSTVFQEVGFCGQAIGGVVVGNL